MSVYLKMTFVNKVNRRDAKFILTSVECAKNYCSSFFFTHD